MAKVEWLDRTLVVSPFFTLCKTEKEFHRALRHIKLDRKDWPDFILTPTAGATTHTFEKNGDLVCIVTVRKQKGVGRKQVYALLVHEAVHVWQELRNSIGEKFPSSEFEAYSIQSISQRLIYAYG